MGESGSGKSVLGLALLGLLQGVPMPTVTGEVDVCGVDMVSASPEVRRAVRRAHLGAIFQDPMTSLNPTMRVGHQVTEAAGSKAEALRLLELVGVPDPARRMGAFPHELSGGLRQRVMIAMAVAGEPSLVIADEPTTALDMTVQAQVLALIRDLCDQLGTSFLLVTHDMGVAAQVADRVAVMYAGRVVEVGTAADVVAAPSHPYTVGLLSARLSLDLLVGHRIPALPGEPPDPRAHPPGCAFAPRCAAAVAACTETVPSLEPATTHDGLAACPVADSVDAIVSQDRTPAFGPMPGGDGSRPVLRLGGVDRHFVVKRGRLGKDKLHALRNVIFDVQPGESVAIVGESGSGKSTLLRIVAGLLEPSSGVLEVGAGGTQMIFQDAGASLTPWLTVGELVGERLLRTTDRAQRSERVQQALRQVGLSPDIAGIKAGQLSGGQRQRVAFARAIIVPPALLLCDEPTSALDASLAASVLNLLQELRRELGMAVMFVTHDLAAARFISDRMVVMYLGQVVEVGPTGDLISSPKHPYLKALLAAIPRPGGPLARLAGEPASPLALPSGCSFHPRCAEKVDLCASKEPILYSIDGSSRRAAACLLTSPWAEQGSALYRPRPPAGRAPGRAAQLPATPAPSSQLQ